MEYGKQPGWKNNRGAALILVIVCIAFVGILGTTVLAATVTNRDMKLVDEKAKENFYSTESGIGIFLANLQKLSEDAMGEEYAYLLTHYDLNGDERLKNGVRRRLWETLTGETAYTPGEEAAVKKDVIESLFSGVNGYGTDFKLRNYTEAVPEVKAKIDGDDLVLLGLSISNIEDGYETQITTDIRVTVEFTKLDIETPVTVAGNYEGYVIIADRNVKNQLTGSSVTGNVYAGNDLIAENFLLTVHADTVIAGDTLKTAVGGGLNISKNNIGRVHIWAGNIATTAGSAGQSITLTDSECYVADDLVLAAKGAAVTITGSYYGYQSDVGAGTASASSAITINAGDAPLDLAGLDTLWIAGRSFVTVPDLYGAEGAASYTEILEGEAISYKGNQLAYLVPEECIREYGHNPLTKKEYDVIAANGGIASYIELDTVFGKEASMTLAPYVSASVPCEVVPVRFMSETEPLYYLYLNFRSGSAAEEYFLAYSTAFRDQMDTYSGILKLGDVLLPDSSKIFTNGTVLRVIEHKITEIIEGTMGAEEALLKQADLKRRFNGLLSTLDENYTGASTGTAVENILRMNEIEKISGTKYFYFDAAYRACGKADAVYQVIIANGDFTSAAQNITGLILADGNVSLSGSAFRGMVIAAGNVTLNAMTMEYNAADGTDFVKELLDRNSSISRYFRNYPLTEAGGDDTEKADGRNITITFENWYKN